MHSSNRFVSNQCPYRSFPMYILCYFIFDLLKVFNGLQRKHILCRFSFRRDLLRTNTLQYLCIIPNFCRNCKVNAHKIMCRSIHSKKKQYFEQFDLRLQVKLISRFCYAQSRYRIRSRQIHIVGILCTDCLFTFKLTV